MIHFPGTPDSAGRFAVIEHLGGVMTITQAAELRVKWKQRVDPIPCEHLTLELELSGTGSTGNYNCIVCGEPIFHQHQ
jgi:hypothetical protein